jgi:hypothetical protein
MKKLLALFCLLMCLAAITHAATNPNFNNALGQAKSIIESIDGVKASDWDEFIVHLHSIGQYSALAASKGRQDFFKNKLVELFDHWRSNRAVAEHDGIDEDVRADFRLGSLDDSTASGDAESESMGGGGSVPTGSVTSKMTRRSTLHNVSSPDRGHMRVDAVLKELDKLRRNADLTDSDAAKARAEALGDAEEKVQEANLNALLANEHLRPIYIKVLLSNPEHRAQVISAIVQGTDYADFRTALITALLAHEPTRNIIVDLLHTAHHTQLVNKIHEGGNRAEMIAKLNGDETSRAEVITDLLTNHLVALIDALRGTQLGAMITSILDNHRAELVARIPTNNDFRNDVIARLIDDGANRNAIATVFVANDAFRAVLIGLLEAGRYAINITRMLWHEIDGADGVAFLADVTARIVTKAAFDHLLAKTRDGYQNITYLTGQRENFRSAFATDNHVGKTGRDLGSDKPI